MCPSAKTVETAKACIKLAICGPKSGFGTLQIINSLNGPQVLQFAFKNAF